MSAASAGATTASGDADLRRSVGWFDALALCALTVLPQLLTGRGRLNADTKQYLYLDPVDLLDRARVIWDSRVGGGTVTHQAIGYLWPMGPFYALTDAVGMPDWAAQRLWVGALQLAAGLGALALFRHVLPRSWVQLPAAAVYALSPFVLGQVTSQSGLLVPYAGLGWLILLMARSVESPRSWRWPAAFALVVTTCGSLNGSSVLFVVLAAAMWVPFALAGTGRDGLRAGLSVLAKAGSLTLLTQLWWLVAYAVGGAHGLPVLDITETVSTTNATSSATEVFRGLGYWTFYGVDTGGPWLRGLAERYMTSLPLLAATFAIPVLALLAGGLVRWAHQAYFTTLIGLGVVLSVGAFPIADPSPAGDAFEWLSRRSEAVLSLRNTQRAAALVALGVAALIAAALTALAAEADPDLSNRRPVVRAGRQGQRAVRGGWRRLLGLSAPAAASAGPARARRSSRPLGPRPHRSPRAGTTVGAVAGAAAVLLLAASALPAQWRDGLVAERFDRPEDLPDAWRAAADHLDEGEGRVLEIPGIDFAAHRWGYALDPISVGLTDRPVITRELVPTGGEAGADLLQALDRSMQEGWFEVAALAPVARLLGASDVLVRNDLEYERYRTVRPRVLWPALTGDDNGLGEPATFGPSYENQAEPGNPMIDETELALAAEPSSLPQVAVFPVPGGGRDSLSARPVAGAVVVDGDGEGVVAAAAAGLIDDLSGPLLLGADVAAHPETFAEVTEPTARYVLTDSNRKRAKRWYTLYENAGATEPADGGVVVDDDADARLEVAGQAVAGSLTTVDWRGAERIWATAYGAPATLLPEDRPSNAFDGDPRTAWRSEREPDGSTRAIGIDLGRPVDADHITLVPSRRHGSVGVTRARVTLDGERRFDVDLSEAEARAPEGVDVALDGRPFSSLTVRILDTAPHIGRGGFAEITIPGVSVDEVVVLPSALVDHVGATLGEAPVAIVLSRLRADPADPLRQDPELSMWRSFDLPASLGVAARGTARLDPHAPGPVLDELLGAGPADWPVRATASAWLQGDVSSRASSAFDGDAGSAWQTPLETGEGQWLEASVARPITAESIGLVVRADDRHSIPTRLELQVDGGEPISLDVPPIAAGTDGTTRHVELTLPRPISGETWRLTLAEVDERTTRDWYTGFPFELPVAFPEVELPGLPVRPTGAVDTGCRDDLLTIAGRPLPVRISGHGVVRGSRGPLDVEACSLLALPQGPVELRTAPGVETGLDLDRLVLTSASWDTAAPAGAAPPEVRVDVDEAAVARGRIRTDGEPFWLVLDESFNDGWELSVDDASVQGPRPVDAFASGWLVQPDRAGMLTARARFGPQRAVNLALIASALAALLCLALLLFAPRPAHRRRDRHRPSGVASRLRDGRGARGVPTFVWARPHVEEPDAARMPWWAVIAAASGAALLIQPAWAIPAAVIALAAHRWRIAGRLAPGLLLGAAAGLVFLEQLRYEHPVAFAWPTHFPEAHRVAMLAAVLLLVLGLAHRGRTSTSRPG